MKKIRHRVKVKIAKCIQSTQRPSPCYLSDFCGSAPLAMGESSFIQLPPTATVQRRPHYYVGMHGISAIQAQDSDIYLTTSPIDVNYQYYRCHAGKRLEVHRINATALQQMPERAGYIDVFDAQGCSGNQRSFRHDEYGISFKKAKNIS